MQRSALLQASQRSNQIYCWWDLGPKTTTNWGGSALGRSWVLGLWADRPNQYVADHGVHELLAGAPKPCDACEAILGLGYAGDAMVRVSG